MGAVALALGAASPVPTSGDWRTIDMLERKKTGMLKIINNMKEPTRPVCYPWHQLPTCQCAGCCCCRQVRCAELRDLAGLLPLPPTPLPH